MVEQRNIFKILTLFLYTCNLHISLFTADINRTMNLLIYQFFFWFFQISNVNKILEVTIKKNLLIFFLNGKSDNFSQLVPLDSQCFNHQNI